MKKTAIAAALALTLGGAAVTAEAGTAGLTGVWTGTYTFAMTSPGGAPVGGSSGEAWTWDFDAGTVDIVNTSLFYGSVWTAHDVTFSDNADGTYGTGVAGPANMFFDWSVNTNLPVAELWDVTAAGTSATVSVVSGVLLGSSAAFPGFHPAFSGSLNQVPSVPVPAAAWLFGSGLLGLVGVARRRRS
jgi:hypothetical protein